MASVSPQRGGIFPRSPHQVFCCFLALMGSQASPFSCSSPASALSPSNFNDSSDLIRSKSLTRPPEPRPAAGRQGRPRSGARRAESSSECRPERRDGPSRAPAHDKTAGEAEACGGGGGLINGRDRRVVVWLEAHWMVVAIGTSPDTDGKV